MTQNATQAKNSRSFAEQSVFVSSIPSSMGKMEIFIPSMPLDVIVYDSDLEYFSKKYKSFGTI